MFENLAAIVISIKELVTSFSIRKFLFWFFGIFIFVLTSLLIFEHYTGNFYYTRINKKIDTIIKIDNQLDKDSQIKKSIQDEYSILIKELNKYKIERKIHVAETIRLSKKQKEGFFKFLSALIVPVLIIVFGRTGESKEEKNNILIGGIMIAILGGIGAIFIPIIYKPCINYIGFPFFEFVILMIIGKLTD